MNAGAPLDTLRAPLQKSKHSVQSPVKGVDPELFSPEELLGGARRGATSTSRPAYSSHMQGQVVQQRQTDPGTSDAQASSSWFQLPWKVGQQDDGSSGPSSRRISGDDRGMPLHQPPMVRPPICIAGCQCCSGYCYFGSGWQLIAMH